MTIRLVCWFLDPRIPGPQHGHDQRLIEAFRQQHHVVGPHERVQSGENRGDDTREVTGQTADQQSQRHDQSQAKKLLDIYRGGRYVRREYRGLLAGRHN